MAGLDPAGLTGWLIIFHVNSEIAFHCSRELYWKRTVKCKEMVHSDEKRDKPGGGKDDGEHFQ